MKAVWCARKKESQCFVWIGKLNLTKGLGGTVSPWVCSVGNHEAKPFGKLQCLAENCMFVKFDKKTAMVILPPGLVDLLSTDKC